MLCAICSVFNYKNKTPFWRVIWAVLTVCTVLFVGMFGYYFVTERIGHHRLAYYYNSKYLSSHIYYHPANSYRLGYVFDTRTEKKVFTGLDWVILSPDDSLAVFSKKHKRGYLNIYTGKEVIPAAYVKAWIFSDGVAAVLENDSVYFINHSGKRIINQGFERSDDEDDYVFHDGYCKVTLNGKFGVIDRTGKIRIPIEYDALRLDGKNFWAVCKNDKWGVMNDSFELIFPCEYRMASISEDNGIYLSDMDNYCRRYSHTGELLDNFVVNGVAELSYDSNDVDKDGNIIYKTAKCMSYQVPRGLYGLMTKNGRPITAPQFVSIEAVNEDLYVCHYECEYDSNAEGVLINSNGEIVRR